MRISSFRNFLLIVSLIGGNAYAQAQLPKCVLFGFGNCIGTLRFSNGDIYTGEFNYGKPNGKGEFTYGNGDSYNGTVVEGQRHGSGTYTSAAGDKYVGQFSEGKFQGIGTYYFLANIRSRGDIYVGEFSSNTFNGQGRYTHSNGQVFVGGFVNGRKSVPIVAPETLLAQAEVQRLAEENAKQKAQLEAERRERLAREKQAATAVIAKQDVQVVPIPSPALAVVVASVGDIAPPKPVIVLAKSESVLGNVEPVGKDSESKDSAVKVPLAAKSRTEGQVTAYGERSKWYVTAGVGVAQSYYCYSSSCVDVKQLNDVGLFLGGGYEFTDYFALESEVFPWTTQTVTVTSSSYSTSSDVVGYKIGGLIQTDLSKHLKLIGGGGYYTIDVNSKFSRTSGTQSQHATYDNFYLSVGAALKITDSTSVRFKWSRYPTKIYGITDSGGFETYDMALKYNF